MRTPYVTKTGVQIGLLYEPPAQGMTAEAFAVQRAFLPKPLTRRNHDAALNAAFVAIGAVIALTLAVAAVAGGIR